MTSTTTNHEDLLRKWAKGSYPDEAAVEMLIRGMGGRFAQPGNPWVQRDEDGCYYLDRDEIEPNVGALSGGERRYLLIVAGLMGKKLEGHESLADLICGLDRPSAELVVAAMSHANGSHEHKLPIITPHEDGTASFKYVEPGPIHDWP